MSGINTALVWDHRGRTGKNCEGPIEYRITIDRKSWYVGTGVKCLKSEWKFGAVIDRPDSNQLNDRLRIIASKIQQEINKCIDSGTAIDVAEIRKQVWKGVGGNESNDMIEWLRKKVAAMEANASTKDHYNVCIDRLAEIGVTSWIKMNVEGLKAFDSHIRKIKGKKYGSGLVGTENITNSTVANYHGKLKHLLKLAMREGELKTNPYDVWQPDIKRTRYDIIDYLSEEELKKFMEWEPKRRAEFAVKDIFIFQCFTGLAYSDAQKFDIGNYRNENGKWIATTRRIKTGVPFVNVLLPPVVEVLERNEWKVPRICLDWYNEVLERIGKKCEFSIKLRSHIARHTFATMMLRNGVKIENLARMLGHTNITQTQRYAKVLALSVQEEFEMIENKMFH